MGWTPPGSFSGIMGRDDWTANRVSKKETAILSTIVAVDLAKTVFELAVAEPRGGIVAWHRFTRGQFERFLTSQPTCHIGMEACGTAHHWGRLARSVGHQVSLLPAQYVRPCVRWHKTDRTDADALVEATRSGSLPTVALKTVAQQEKRVGARRRSAPTKRG
jgi:transposase